MKINNLFVFGLVAALLLAGCAGYGQANVGAGAGRVVFAVTDAAADMGSVSSVKMTIDKVEAHNDAQGWVTVSTASKTYDLIALKAQGKTVVLADYQLQSGTYQQVRLHISNVVVTDSSGDHTAKLPSNELKIIGNTVVQENTTSSVLFDFIVDKSLHVTGDGQYIFAPVVHFQTREKTRTEVRSDESVDIQNGQTDDDKEVGMDVNGNVQVGAQIPANARLNIESNGRIGISG
ncbi:MAG TPA: DUF4382 domain-containing protein [Candidatus Norongarragalinales archaeon]|jgi:hypothetical protein|nr:DUF4382 domain-containing protein [Candidatus Norongarragalinales archaeon]